MYNETLYETHRQASGLNEQQSWRRQWQTKHSTSDRTAGRPTDAAPSRITDVLNAALGERTMFGGHATAHLLYICYKNEDNDGEATACSGRSLSHAPIWQGNNRSTRFCQQPRLTSIRWDWNIQRNRALRSPAGEDSGSICNFRRRTLAA